MPLFKEIKADTSSSYGIVVILTLIIFALLFNAGYRKYQIHKLRMEFQHQSNINALKEKRKERAKAEIIERQKNRGKPESKDGTRVPVDSLMPLLAHSSKGGLLIRWPKSEA